MEFRKVKEWEQGNGYREGGIWINFDGFCIDREDVIKIW